MMDQPRDKFRRAMIVISDGQDTESRMSRDQALEMAQKADVVIYAISTNITRDDSDGDKVLRYLTEETGGQAFFPVQDRRSGSVVREHRQRAAAPVQHLLSPGAAEDGWFVSSRHGQERKGGRIWWCARARATTRQNSKRALPRPYSGVNGRVSLPTRTRGVAI